MTGAPILAQSVSGVRVAVEVAWGADLTDLTSSSWTWTDITSDVQMSAEGNSGAGCLTIQLGTPDESPGQQTQTSQFTCVLDNRAGKYSQGGQSPNWPNVVRNTPVRVRVSTDNGSTWTLKYQGGAVSWQPAWDAVGRWATVLLTAAGPLRRLNQGTLNAPSAMQEGTLTDPTVVAYWPCEDGQNSSFAAPVVGTGVGVFSTYSNSVHAEVDGVPGQFASYANIPSSAPMLTLADGGNLECILSAPSSGSQSCTSAFFGNVTSVPVFSDVVDPSTGVHTQALDPVSGHPVCGAILTVYTPNGGSIKVWEISYNGSGELVLQGYDNATHVFLDSVFIFADAITFGLQANTDYEIGLNLTQSGNTTSYVFWVHQIGMPSRLESPPGSHSNSGAGAQVADVQLGCYADCPGLNVGQVVVRNATLPNGRDVAWVNAFMGESVTARFNALCTQANIPLQILDSPVPETSTNPADKMGPQYVDTLTNLLRECEATGQGVLYDGLGPGLSYVTRLRRESQQPLMTLDASAGDLAVEFAPLDDDQLTINDVQISRRNGTTVGYQDVTGPLGTDAIGDYQTSLTVNPSDDMHLKYTAQWMVHLGTIPGYRYPAITFALDRIPSKIASWLTMTPSSRFDITDISGLRSQMPSDRIRNVLEGWTETIDAFSWHVTANCSNWNAWNVGTMAASTGTTVDTVMRRDTDGSAVNTAAAAGATSVSVKLTASGKPLWTTAADDFPMVVSMGGVPVTVTAISGTSSPQTFTVPAGVPIALVVDDPVELWNPPVLGM